jgi:hypothetical protein
MLPSSKQKRTKLSQVCDPGYFCTFFFQCVRRKKSRPFLISLSSPDHDYVAAARLYTEAIALNPLEPTLWCNRAFARMKLEEYGYALSDASEYNFFIRVRSRSPISLLF